MGRSDGRRAGSARPGRRTANSCAIAPPLSLATGTLSLISTVTVFATPMDLTWRRWSSGLPATLNRHRAQLRLGAHPDRALQKDWNRHGADSFEFEVLDTLTPIDTPDDDPTGDLRALEELWIERLGTA